MNTISKFLRPNIEHIVIHDAFCFKYIMYLTVTSLLCAAMYVCYLTEHATIDKLRC
jgi:hypothetical protein